MSGKTNQKLTARTLERLAKAPPTDNVFDTELAGYHVRPGKRGLTFRLYYRTKTGRQRILTIGRYGTLTAAQARENAIEALAIVAQGGDPRAVLEEARIEEQRQQQQTLGAYLAGPYTAFQNRKKDGKGTLRRIEKDFSCWLNKSMSSLSRDQVERWQAEQESKDKPLAFGSLKRSYDAMHALLVHAAERKVIPANPLAGVKLQKPAMSDDAMADQAVSRRYLDDEEVEALFFGLEAYQDDRRQQRRSSRCHGKAYLPDLEGVTYVDHVKPWILTMYYTGFRPGDITGLRWEHVNLTFATIRKVVEKTAHHHPDPMTFPLSVAALDVLKDGTISRANQRRGWCSPQRGMVGVWTRRRCRNPGLPCASWRGCLMTCTYIACGTTLPVNW